MAETVQTAPDDLLTCEKCHGFYAVEVPADGSDPRVRCNACGHIREVPIAPVQEKAEDGKQGKWTVIGPDGKVMTYPSWEKLVEERHPSVMTEVAKVLGPGSSSKIAAAKHEEKRQSATALLDITPTPALPKLTLAELDSDPNLLAAAPSPLDLAKSIAKSKPPEKSKGPEWAPIKSKAPPAPVPEKSEDEKPASGRELESGALADDASLRSAAEARGGLGGRKPTMEVEEGSDDEPAPLSLRDAIVDPDDEPAPLSLRDAIVEDPADSAHEVLSTRDVQVIPPADDSAVDSTPPPPKRGVLKTLPPMASTSRATAPPPTITVEEPPASSKKAVERDKATTEATAKKADGKKNGASKDTKKSDASKDAPKKPSTSKTTGAAASKDERKPVASAKAAVADDEQKRGWLLPSLAVAGIAIVIWRMMAASPATETPAPAPPVAATATATETAAPAETATTSTPSDTAATATPAAPAETTTMPAAATDTAAPAPTTTSAPVATAERKTTTPASTDTKPAAEKKPATPAETGMSMSDLLDRAGSAKRSGDYATARELYERVIKMNPGNVEANGGLGDVARAQGDLNAAKASYERALAASPAYGPAQLGLADTEWDLGNRAGAQRRYAQIVERLGDRAPERAKQRGVVTE